MTAPASADLGPLFAGRPAPGPVPDPAERVLRAHFGHATFRPGQRAAIDACLEGRDATVVLPTGGGKSLCYQVPAVVLAEQGAGPTLVVSPLVALMQDQVAALRMRGVEAVALFRGMDSSERRSALAHLGDHALIYASPERLAGAGFRRALARAGVARVAVDEAHCIAEWGPSFREDYLRLGILKEELGAPVMALTATVTPRALREVVESLGLTDPVSVRGGFERPNLRLSVELHRGDKRRAERLRELLEAAGLGRDAAAGRVVVYAATRKRVQAVAKGLVQAGFRAGFYHAGRTDRARERAQQGFEEGKHAILVATTAFGMGVDLPDVRLVVHVQAPGSLEAYYQQAGRAGRDGKPSQCTLLYAPGDAHTQARLRGASPPPGAEVGWRAMQDYIYGTDCRQQAMVRWFTGQAGAACGHCDVCEQPERVSEAVSAARADLADTRRAVREKQAADLSVQVEDEQRATIVAFVGALRKPVGRHVLVAGLRGSQAKPVKRARLSSNPHFGALCDLPEAALLREVDALLAAGTLARKGRKYPTVWLPGKPVRGPSSPRAPASTGLVADLRRFRQREARRRRFKPYQVFPDQLLQALVAERPATPAQLLRLPGMGPTRMARYGSQLLEIVRQHEENG